MVQQQNNESIFNIGRQHGYLSQVHWNSETQTLQDLAEGSFQEGFTKGQKDAIEHGPTAKEIRNLRGSAARLMQERDSARVGNSASWGKGYKEGIQEGKAQQKAIIPKTAAKLKNAQGEVKDLKEQIRILECRLSDAEEQRCEAYSRGERRGKSAVLNMDNCTVLGMPVQEISQLVGNLDARGIDRSMTLTDRVDALCFQEHCLRADERHTEAFTRGKAAAQSSMKKALGL